ncbi:MAG: AraC family transcriptional regulator [Muribaculaceae bacterium]|nr:AraC family transcriptional regulator [Muribaculaceae bacterium]MDE6551779.1 AraC family transcriptional regulator [Muribaculaceae bacterium]
MSLVIFFPVKASVTSAPVLAYNYNNTTDNPDISIFIDSDQDKDSVFNEYHTLEREYANLSVIDIMTKASHHFVNRKNMDKGAMLFMVVISRYNDYLDNLEKLNCAAAYGNMGYYLVFERNNPIQAYPFLVKALQILDKIDFKDQNTQSHKINTIVAVYTNIAKVFAACGDFQRALHYYQHAYRTAKEENNAIALPLAFTDLLHYGWTLDSIPTIKKQILEFTDLKVPNSVYRYMYDYAKIMAKGAQKHSERSYNEALVLVDSASNALDPYIDDGRYFVTNRIIAGKIAIDGKNYVKAMDILHEIDSIIKKGKLEDLYEITYNLHSSLRLAMGDMDMASKYRNEALRVRDSLNQIHSYSVVHNMELSMQAKDLNDRLSDSRKETQFWTYIAMVAGVLILVICVLVVRILLKNRRLKEQSESLFHKNLELMDANRKFQEASEDEVDEFEKMSWDDDTNRCQPEESNQEEHTSRLDELNQGEETLAGIYRRIVTYMSDSPEIFTPAFTIETLADAIGLRLKSVSQAINSVGGKNFSSLLAEFRIKKACKEMLRPCSDPSQRPTIEALAEEVGYKSRTHFMRVFKSVTGMTTTEFLREAKKK